jgi:predicted nucleic acid-binding protein
MTSPTGEIVVCDASPLIVLARVDQLDLLRLLFRRVLVPPAVSSEVTRRPDAVRSWSRTQTGCR